ncbi:MAG: DUF1540 domain-containing protein [Clostridiaceae bacterium]
MSPKVTCDAENCVYNQNKLCNADSVQITGLTAHTSGATQCETFKQG